MNFCEESELYISLYIDDQMDNNLKDQFLEHLENCPKCSQKLKEETLIAQLCKEDESFALPANFSESLHSRLIEVSKKENNKKKILVFNKKAMAAISSAAVVIISILAYNLLPSIGIRWDKTTGHSDAASSQNAFSQDASTAENGYGELPKEANKALGGSSKEAQPSEEAKSNPVDNEAVVDVKASKSTITFSISVEQQKEQTQKAKSPVGTENNQQAGEAKKEKTSAGSEGETEESQNIFMTMVEDEKEISARYYTNYVEMNLFVISPDEGLKKIQALMTENGAIELKSGLINEFAENMQGISAYIDYVMPISVFSSLKSQALLKYSLELDTKTDIIKKEITEEYISLENQKTQNQNKMNEALQAGEDISAYEAEKSLIDKKLSELITSNDMITVRIFFVNK